MLGLRTRRSGVGPKVYHHMRVNWAHPISRGLVFLAPFNENSVNGHAPRDIVYPHAVANSSGGCIITNTTLGPGMDTGAGFTMNWGEPPKLNVSNTTDFSILVVATVDAGGSTFRQLFSSDSATGTRSLVQFRINSSNKLEIIYGNSGGTLEDLAGTATISTNASQIRQFGTSRVHGTATNLYIDGLLDKTGGDASTGTWTAGTAFNWGTVIGGATPGAYRGKYVLIAFWTRALGADEFLHLRNEPFLLLSRPRSLFALNSVSIVGLTVTASDSISLSEALTVGYGSIITDTVTLVDVVTIATDGTLTAHLNDTLSLSDTVSLQLGLLELLTDTISLSDFVQFALGIVLSASDTLTFTDAMSLVLDLLTRVQDQLNLLDSVKTANRVDRRAADNILLSDFATARMFDASPISDTVTITDTFRMALASLIQVSDTLDLSDSINTFITDHLFRTAADQITLIDDLTISLDVPTSLDSYLRRYLNDVKMP